ncbi:hypothetical protein BVRB_7g163100 [Beta vulgaris subsp. vulgaris]|nr:hypothetical protein BVRB_7g163100 [Beta vulgaris subsp. vulgaris]
MKTKQYVELLLLVNFAMVVMMLATNAAAHAQNFERRLLIVTSIGSGGSSECAKAACNILSPCCSDYKCDGWFIGNCHH